MPAARVGSRLTSPTLSLEMLFDARTDPQKTLSRNRYKRNLAVRADLATNTNLMPGPGLVQMNRCVHHSSRMASRVIFDEKYCSECGDGIAKARGLVDKHIEPNECFVSYAGHGNWYPIEGTGCAHWVAHQLDIRQGRPGEKCLAGYIYRVRALLSGRKRVPDALLQFKDIYVAPDMSHAGLVHRVTFSGHFGSPRRVFIRHAANVKGGIIESEFYNDFDGRGYFYR
jgi:hypothetical protein